MTSPVALHSAKTPKWGTPGDIVELARKLMGVIHLDPASSEEFNKIVQALMFYTELSNGLAPDSDWYGNVFLNSPGGRVPGSRKTFPGLFWDKLIESYLSGKVSKALWVGFSVEQLCVFADKEYHPLDFSTVILRDRLDFLDEATLEPNGLPSHGNYITAIGCDPELFEELFGGLGKIYHGKLVVDKRKQSL